MKGRRRRRMTMALAALVLVSAGFVTLGMQSARDDVFFSLKKNFGIFGSLYEELAVGYVDPVDPEKMMRVGIDAMLGTLDPYTTFFNEADNEQMEMRGRGGLGTVGLDLGIRDGRITVVAPAEGYSGFKQGVRAGDVILSTDGNSIQGLSISDVGSLLEGAPGTTVTLQVERSGEDEPVDFVLTRSAFRSQDVSFSGWVEDSTSGIGFVKLQRFGRTASAEVRTAIQDLQKRSELKGLILDLRDNPGGLLDGAVDIAGMFIPANSMIVSTRGRNPQMDRAYRSRKTPIMPDLPLVVLINEISASASEIVAGAVQDLDRGAIVGSQSFGKGLVQIVRPLPYNTSFKMTTSKYYTPSGRCIQAINYVHDGTASLSIPDSLRSEFKTKGGRIVRDGGGIEPDYAVERAPMSELETALLRNSSFFLFANEYAASHPEITADFQPDDTVVAEFKAWLESRDFTYRTKAERRVEDLTTELSDAGYTDALEAARQITEDVTQDKAEDFDRHAPALKERLRAEILARSLGETAQIQASLSVDPQVLEAAKLVRDGKRYGKLLGR